ncbi:DUF2076 domain-containing protein [Nitrospirillum sp. BR 11828]|uniref:DUF2076 domain-containing protein n=1 Tax=Nitrospirillum sp. BR 11828 TaxID=3104325 RepID=UPI002ACA05B4|nr:DUF2076 domain-containing protein [Nitrospirillum sp. BR 11828]MDZ5648851.1 DUF2076 domain-containing protein [Nitrospirillum sp. BR 11828]
MTPKDREDLTALLARVSRLDGMPRDPESDRLVGEALSRQPALPYIMAQALLAQQEALVDAQRRLADLQQTATARPQGGPPPFTGPSSGQSSAPSSPGPWGQSSYPAQQPQAPYGQAAYGQTYAPQQPAYGQPAYGAPPVYAQPRSFMRGMFETMAGVAGGVLAADAVESLFRGGHGALGGGLGGSPWGAGYGGDRIDETVINNTTVNETIVNENGGGFDPGRQDAGYRDDNYRDDTSGYQDASYDTADDGGFDDGSIDT